LILTTVILLILLEAVYEGLKQRKAHIASEIVEFVFLSLVVFCSLAWVSGIVYPFVTDHAPLWKILGGYVLFRLALFDLIWNIAAAQKLFYLGRTKLYDKLLKKVPWGFVWFVKFICLCISLAWLLNYGQ